MNIGRSAPVNAALLFAAAAAGLLITNLGGAVAVHSIERFAFGPASLGLHLSVETWITDGLLAIFFATAAAELKAEFLRGQLSSVNRAMSPAIAACGGVAAPALIYLAFTHGGPDAGAWPVPTATDIAFSLGVLALFGKRIPVRVRAFLLALAVLDDLIGIGFIAVIFTRSLDVTMLFVAAFALVVFWMCLFRWRGGGERAWWSFIRLVIAIIAAVVVWAATLHSGIHPTIAGVLVGALMPLDLGTGMRRMLEPWVNAVILPMFAFVAAAVVIPSAPLSSYSAVFWAIAVALPVGKFVGILLAGALPVLLSGRGRGDGLRISELAAIGLAGGVGFTVSLLMGHLAFRGRPEIIDEATLGVLIGSAIALLAATLAFALLARRGADRR